MDAVAARQRLLEALGVTEADLEVLDDGMWHWAHVTPDVPPELAEWVLVQYPQIAAEMTAVGHAQGWLPEHLEVHAQGERL